MQTALFQDGACVPFRSQKHYTSTPSLSCTVSDAPWCHFYLGWYVFSMSGFADGKSRGFCVKRQYYGFLLVLLFSLVFLAFQLLEVWQWRLNNGSADGMSLVILLSGGGQLPNIPKLQTQNSTLLINITEGFQWQGFEWQLSHHVFLSSLTSLVISHWLHPKWHPILYFWPVVHYIGDVHISVAWWILQGLHVELAPYFKYTALLLTRACIGLKTSALHRK